MQSHDPIRQLSFIQQALSQNRKPIGFFIGAGCPLSIRVNRNENGKVVNEPLISDVAGLTKIISLRLTSSDKDKPSGWDKIVNIIVDDKGDCNNIELLLSKVRALRSVVGHGLVRGMDAKDLDDLDMSICQVISDEVNRCLPHKETPYHNLAIWSRSIRREKPVHFFTTNYDLLLEQALEESSAPYFDGFIGSRKAFFDLGAVEDEGILPARWSRLWKIHGSLNWRLEDGKRVFRSYEKKDNNSYLIYPSHLKYDQSRKMPYLAMLDRLKYFLLSPSAILFICGYSFADEHINDIICRSLDANPTAHVFAFLYGDLDDSKYELGKNCAFSTPNLSVIGFNKAIIGRNLGKWQCEDIESLNLPPNILIRDGTSTSLRLGDFAVLGNLLRGLSDSEGHFSEI
ncbi:MULTISPECIES: SIR2 family NAD-dependent protein deacylase [Pectobacterium]|uniref:SIR2 family NAD-dependent protein deacylase n=1 Tax=Pectobacterium jejuense TaxID=2974022 RepID=A0ABW8GUV0_9GAMM|nr:SIR2 family protein [Pectobacterium carotovorum]QRN37846.1 SIR2 family protein [Pectobacterium carotovorum]GKW08085.1 SIR2 family protein [Pectobacterium carotovorum subsp. carotovorum]